MKRIISLSVLLVATLWSFAQVDTISTNIYQKNGRLGIGINNPSHLLSIFGSPEMNKKEELAKFSLQNDTSSYLLIGNSTYNNYYYVPSIKGFTMMPNQPGLVLRGMVNLSNDNSEDALIHITPYVLDGENILYPQNRHYLGIQGYQTGTGEKSLFEIDENGYVGIGIDNPQAKLQVSDGDIYISDIEKGIIMKSPDGNCWRGVLDNSGNLSFTQIDCPDSYSANSQMIKSSNSATVYPNPANERVIITIENNEFKVATYIISDMSGKKISYGEFRGNTHEIDFSSFNSGLYIVKIIDKNENLISTQKIVKR